MSDTPIKNPTIVDYQNSGIWSLGAPRGTERPALVLTIETLPVAGRREEYLAKAESNWTARGMTHTIARIELTNDNRWRWTRMKLRYPDRVWVQGTPNQGTEADLGKAIEAAEKGWLEAPTAPTPLISAATKGQITVGDVLKWVIDRKKQLIACASPARPCPKWVQVAVDLETAGTAGVVNVRHPGGEVEQLEMGFQPPRRSGGLQGGWNKPTLEVLADMEARRERPHLGVNMPAGAAVAVGAAAAVDVIRAVHSEQAEKDHAAFKNAFSQAFPPPPFLVTPSPAADPDFDARLAEHVLHGKVTTLLPRLEIIPDEGSALAQLRALQKEVEAVLAGLPDEVLVRVREGAGEENLAASLALSVAKLRDMVNAPGVVQLQKQLKDTWERHHESRHQMDSLRETKCPKCGRMHAVLTVDRCWVCEDCKHRWGINDAVKYQELLNLMGRTQAFVFAVVTEGRLQEGDYILRHEGNIHGILTGDVGRDVEGFLTNKADRVIRLKAGINPKTGEIKEPYDPH